MDNSYIQSLWIGGTLGTLERLSMLSFLKNGHTYHLYAYGAVENLPEGVELKNAEEILPFERVFRYGKPAGKGEGSYAGFSNFFRYRLLLMKGGYWVDTDVICLKPFDFDQEYVFASELWPENNTSSASSCLMKVPAGCTFAKGCWDFCQAQDPAQLRWGETGPFLVTRMIKQSSLIEYVKPYDSFCPITFLEIEKFLEPEFHEYLGNSYAIHFWNEEWRRRGYDKEKSHDPRSLYEQLKAYYLKK